MDLSIFHLNHNECLVLMFVVEMQCSSSFFILKNSERELLRALGYSLFMNEGHITMANKLVTF